MPGVAGFALVFAPVFAVLLLYALDQPSLWLPLLFAAGFFGILQFAPRLVGRFSLAGVFGAISCLLWLRSGSETFSKLHDKLEQAFQAAFLALAMAFAAGAWFKLARDRQKRLLGPVFALMFLGWLVSFFSGSKGSADPMVEWLVRTFGLEPLVAENLIVAFRKGVHLCFYGVVAGAAYLMALGNGSPKRIALWAGMCTALVFGAFDELRQSALPDRVGSVWDVLLDLVGAATALILISAVSPTKRKKSRKL